MKKHKTPEEMEAHRNTVYKKRPGSANVSGVFYEHYMSLLLFTRATSNEWEFRMAQNMLEAYDFDDVVINFPFLSKTFFIQLKHKTSSQVITINHLQNLSGDFSLFKYFKSYCLLKEHYSKNLSHLGKFEDFVFVIYTNCTLNELVKTCVAPLEEKWINFLHTGGEAHCFNVYHFEKIIELLDKRETYTSLLQKAVESISLLSSEEERSLLSFLQIFSNNNLKVLPNRDELQRELKRFMTLFEINESGEVKKVKDMTTSSFEGFLKQLVIFSKQSSEGATEVMILQELEQIYMRKISDTSCIDTLRKEFQKVAKGSRYITPASNFWVDVVIKPWIQGLSKEILEELESLLKVTFTDEEYGRIFIPIAKVQINIADKGGAKLSILKIHQCLKSEPHIMLTWKNLSEQYQEVLSLWHRWCDILVLEMETNVNINAALQEMNEILKLEKKRLIIITEHANSIDLNATVIDDTANIWNSVSRESKKELLDVKVVVQGTETTFGEAVGEETDKWTQVVSSSFLLHLMKAKAPIQFGGTLKSPDIYIKRPLQRFQTLNDSVVQILRAKFAISGITALEFQQRFSVGIMFNRFAMISTTKQFNRFASKFKNENVHWLHYNGSALVWKRSIGDMSDLIKHVALHSSKPKTCDPEKILSQRRMLLTAESGMGKSTFLSHMAAKIKSQKGGTIWIAKINLENHRRAFDYSARIPKELDLMLAAQKIHNSKHDKVFLEMMLKTGRVAVFFDSVDELSHSNSVLKVLRNFRKYSHIILWVASRPISGGRLETLFQMLPYSLPYFTYVDQQQYLLHKWAQEDLDISRVRKFIQLILKNVHMHPCGVPLLLLIISETFQEELMNFINNGTLFTLSEAIDNVFLHEKYIRKKLEIYCERNGVNVNVKSIVEAFYMENHMLLSLAEVININQLEIASYLKTKVCSLDMERIQNMGIIHISSSGGSSFLHRSFAEYFVALWFKMYHSCSVHYLRDQIFRQEFQPTRKFLDCLLAKGFSLHSAIIKGKKYMKYLPKSKIKINKEDIGGRTPLHLLVLVCKDEMSFGDTSKYDSSVSLAQKLLNGGANPNATDQMLGWSCTQYALQAETWALLELMLKYGADSHSLSSITNKLNNRSSRNTLLSTIARCGFTNLLDYVLKYIDVNKYVTHTTGTLKTMLHVAVEADHLEVVKQLIIAGANVNLQIMERANRNGTALHIAAQKGNLRIAQYLLEHHALLSATGAFGRVPIEEAAVFSKWKMVRYLSDQGAEHIFSPLICAVKRGKLSVVRHLYRNHNLNLSARKKLMHLAIVSGKLDIVKYFVSQGLTLSNVHTSLMMAAKFGMLGIVKYLIQNGAAVNAIIQGHTALYAAVVSGKRKTVNFLKKTGGSFNSRESEIEAFHEAVRLGTTKTLNVLLENIQVDERSKAGWTALHIATWVGNNNVIAFLLKKGANINAIIEKPCRSNGDYFDSSAPHLVGNSALHLAAARGKVDTLKLLVHKGADTNMYNKDGETALHIAACRGHYNVLNYLCTVYNVNSVRTRKTDLVLHCAIRHKNLEVIRCLTDECNAEVNAKGRNGSTPLCLAVEYSSPPLVLHLLNRGADINGRDDVGNTPLILSAHHSKLDIMRILLRRGAVTDCQNKKGSTALHVAAGSLNFEKVWTLINKGNINVHIRDRKGRTALEIAHQRCQRKPDCKATVHKYEKQDISGTHISSKYGNRKSCFSSKNTEKCVCVNKYAAKTALYIVNCIQKHV